MRLPVCGCGRVMDCTKTGMTVLLHTEDKQPYQLWASDEYTCGTCKAKVAIIQSQAAIAEYWQPGFDATLRNAESPDGRRKLLRGYYKTLPTGTKLTIAGVEVSGGDGTALELSEDGSIHFVAIPSSVDSTTAQVQTPSTTEAP